MTSSSVDTVLLLRKLVFSVSITSGQTASNDDDVVDVFVIRRWLNVRLMGEMNHHVAVLSDNRRLQQVL